MIAVLLFILYVYVVGIPCALVISFLWEKPRGRTKVLMSLIWPVIYAYVMYETIKDVVQTIRNDW